MACQDLLKMAFTRQVFVALQKNYKEAQHLYEVKLKTAYMCIKICNIWSKRGRKWGGEHMYQYKIKRFFTFHAVKSNDTLQERAKPFIKIFLHANSAIEALKIKVRKLNKLVSFMQKRIRDQLVFKVAKCEVLHNYWDKVTGNILQRACNLKDDVGTGLIRKMIVVPREVRESVLRAYVDKCRVRHNIAFFQWRLRFPNDLKFDH